MSRPQHQPRRGGNSYKSQQYQKSKLLDWNQSGIFFTCEFEKDGVREAQNLLSKYEVIEGPSQPANPEPEPEGELDIADELKRQCEALKRPKSARRVRQQPTGVKHCLFFNVPVERDAIADFVDKFVDDCQATQQCRYLLRALPVEDISPVEVESLKNRLQRIVRLHFDAFAAKPENEGKHASFAVDYKKRFNDKLERQTVLDLVCEVVMDIDKESKVNLTCPDFTIVVHVIRSAVLLACIRDYNQRRKFSLKPPGDDSTQVDGSGIAAPSAD